MAAGANDVAALQAMDTEAYTAKWHGMLPAHTAAAHNALPSLDYLLRQSTASVDVMDESGRTPLMHAIAGHSAEAIVWLVRHGANASLKDGDGRTAIHWCARLGFASLIALLVNLGVDAEVPDESGKTPLETAVLYEQLDVVEYLLQLLLHVLRVHQLAVEQQQMR